MSYTWARVNLLDEEGVSHIDFFMPGRLVKTGRGG